MPGTDVNTLQIRRPGVVTVLALLQFMGGALWLLVATIGLVAAVSAPAQSRDLSLALLLAMLLALAAFQIVCGIGLWRLRSYGRTMQIVTAGVGLLALPFGTLVSLVILVYLFKPGIKLLFSGRKPEELSAQEITDLNRAMSGGRAATVLVVLGVVVVGTFVVGIVAAITLPGLLRARIAGNEAAEIGALRAISSAEMAYAGANSGYYDSEQCLVAPSSCLRNYSGPAFLGQEFGTRNGYQMTFVPGPAPLHPSQDISPSSVTSFVVVASPISVSTGRRVFCLDQTGAIRTGPARDLPTISAGGCPTTWPQIS